ncbi:MAG: hypothetical protein R3E97_03515 [Candidatus Eisenbacteria bacterium]
MASCSAISVTSSRSDPGSIPTAMLSIIGVLLSMAGWCCYGWEPGH